MAKARRKTGEKQQVRQPFYIDRLPQKMRDRILFEKNRRGRTLLEIQDGSPGWEEWSEVTPEVLKLFPKRELPKSNLQRWLDVRYEQVQGEIAATAAQAREMAGSLAKIANVEELGEAAVQALGDSAFSMLNASTPTQRAKAVEGLGYLAAKLIDAKAKKLRAEAEAKRIELVERELNEKKKQADAATKKVAAKAGKGKAITIDDINTIRERVYGLPKLKKDDDAA